jgi:hypothetical protein
MLMIDPVLLRRDDQALVAGERLGPFGSSDLGERRTTDVSVQEPDLAALAV